MGVKFEMIYTVIDERRHYWDGQKFVLNSYDAKHYISARSAIKLLTKSPKFKRNVGIKKTKQVSENSLYLVEYTETPPLFIEVVKHGSPYQLPLFA